jgi:hypothetical protein
MDDPRAEEATGTPTRATEEALPAGEDYILEPDGLHDNDTDLVADPPRWPRKRARGLEDEEDEWEGDADLASAVEDEDEDEEESDVLAAYLERELAAAAARGRPDEPG